MSNLPDQTETFRWREQIFDVGALLGDLADKTIVCPLIHLNEKFVKAYCELYLLSTEDPIDSERPPIRVDLGYANQLKEGDLGLPIILLHVGKYNGLVSLSEDSPRNHYVVADGNHRLLAARRLNLGVSAFLLSETQSINFARNIG